MNPPSQSSGIDPASWADLMQSGAVQPAQLDLSSITPTALSL